ncbi:MAG: tetratricopeptide repeat protein [Magnetococcales bacterium]|nr:tetratricopeptide repeat protein [Magnetococcales bacterium]
MVEVLWLPISENISNTWGTIATILGILGVLIALIKALFFPAKPHPTAEEIAIKICQISKNSDHPSNQETYPECKKAITQVVKDIQSLNTTMAKKASKELEQGKITTAIKLFEESLNHNKELGEKANKQAAKDARNLGALAFLNETKKALSYYQQAVELDPDDPDGWNRLGHLLFRTGEIDAAMAASNRVLELGEKSDDYSLVAVAYGNLGILYRTRGDLARAEEMHLKSLSIEKELGRKEGMASQYGNLGIVFGTRGNLTKAEDMFLKSLSIEKELGRKEGMASQYGNLGIVYRKRGDLARAEEIYLKSLAIEKELGRKEGMASDYGNLGNVYLTRGDLARAEEMYLKSLAIEKELGRKEYIANQYANLGLLYEIKGDLDKARKMWQKSIGLFKKVGMPHMVKIVQGLLDSLGGLSGANHLDNGKK